MKHRPSVYHCWLQSPIKSTEGDWTERKYVREWWRMGSDDLMGVGLTAHLTSSTWWIKIRWLFLQVRNKNLLFKAYIHHYKLCFKNYTGIKLFCHLCYTAKQTSYAYIYNHLFFILSSMIFNHEWLATAPCAIQQDLTAYPLQMQEFALFKIQHYLAIKKNMSHWYMHRYICISKTIYEWNKPDKKYTYCVTFFSFSGTHMWHL